MSHEIGSKGQENISQIERNFMVSFNKTTEKYFLGPVYDDGLEDAKAHARAIFDLEKEANNIREMDRWSAALHHAEVERGRSSKRLRKEIWREARRYSRFLEEDLGPSRYVRALKNLASSIQEL